MPTTSRTLIETERLYGEAQRVIAGGVSSDARRMAPLPLYIDRAAGSRMWDVDGNEYVDYVLGQGPLILGHTAPEVIDAVARQLQRGQAYSAQHALEVEVATAICEMVPGSDRVRFNSVGSEAVHAAWRLARAFTGRERILKFEGHYHGWLDPALYSVHPDLAVAGPAGSPLTVRGSRGQQAVTAGDLVVAPWNDLPAFEAIYDQYGPGIAAVICEPICCNTGCISPDPGFLEAVRDRCHEGGSLLIFDEVITGFRIAPGGAQEYLGITADLAVFGKALGGGFPVSCLAGRAEVMDLISRGDVSHAGTFNSNPVAMAAAAATLRALRRDGDSAYGHLTDLGQRLMAGLRSIAAEEGLPLLVEGPGPVFQTYLTEAPGVRDYRDFAATDRPAMGRLHQALLDRGVNVVARGLWFLSTAHTQADLDLTLTAFRSAVRAR